ncbi:hypothetical protein ACHAPT_011308 [Fusarium lateritium]
MADPVAHETSLFLSHYSQQPKGQEDLLNFLRALPEVEQVSSLLPLDDYETRLGVIAQLRDTIRVGISLSDFQFTYIQFCYLIRMPLDHLNGALVIALLQKKGFDDRVSARGSNASQPQAKKRRDKHESDNCRTLDHDVCVVTGASRPEVCHIIPLAWNNSLPNQVKTSRLESAMDIYLGLPKVTADDVRLTNDALKRLSIAPGSSDHTWNMLCLSPLLHDWWSQAFFGIKFIGATPISKTESSVKLQFVWMPRNIQTGLATTPAKLEEEQGPNKRLSTLVTHYHGGSPGSCSTPDCETCAKVGEINCHNVKLGRAVWSGSIIHVTRITKEVPLFQRMIEIQWAIICAAALSGRAQDPDLQLRRDGDGPAQGSSLVEEDILEWMQHVQQPGGGQLEKPTT